VVLQALEPGRHLLPPLRRGHGLARRPAAERRDGSQRPADARGGDPGRSGKRRSGTRADRPRC
jgi:hypothetical protein